MKIKTSITLSEEVLREIDQISGESRNRSAFIENAIQDYLKKRAKKISDDRDLEILNRNSKRLKRDLDRNMKHMQHMRDRLHEGIKVVSSQQKHQYIFGIQIPGGHHTQFAFYFCKKILKSPSQPLGDLKIF